MRGLFAVSLLPVLFGTSAAAAPAPSESWGKSGITLAQYRKDAIECGLQGYYTDISKTQDAKVFVDASKQLDAITSGGASSPMTVDSNPLGPDSTTAIDQAVRYGAQQQHIVDNVRVDRRFDNIKKTLVSNDQQCLVKRGYSKFVLTDEQRKALRKLKAGSDQRRAYLYSLASDPAVLANQKATAQP
jgi:hypothetical protein